MTCSIRAAAGSLLESTQPAPAIFQKIFQCYGWKGCDKIEKAGEHREAEYNAAPAPPRTHVFIMSNVTQPYEYIT